jgi:hypothetical protein
MTNFKSHSHMLHGAGIFTYMIGWFWGEMLVNIPYMEHLGFEHLPIIVIHQAQIGDFVWISGSLLALNWAIQRTMNWVPRWHAHVSSAHNPWSFYYFGWLRTGFPVHGKKPFMDYDHPQPHHQSTIKPSIINMYQWYPISVSWLNPLHWWVFHPIKHMAFHQGSTGSQHLASQDLLVDAHGILSGCVTVRSWTSLWWGKSWPRNIQRFLFVKNVPLRYIIIS